MYHNKWTVLPVVGNWRSSWICRAGFAGDTNMFMHGTGIVFVVLLPPALDRMAKRKLQPAIRHVGLNHG